MRMYLCPRPVADPLHHHTILGKSVARELEVLNRVNVARASVKRLDDVGGEDVVSTGRRPEILAPISQVQSHILLAHHIVIDVAEPLGPAHDRSRKLDHIDRQGWRTTENPRSGAAAKPYHERVPWVGVEGIGELADFSMHPDHFR